MAINKGAGSRRLFEQLPATYFLRRRKKVAKCPRCDSKVQTMRVAERTGYYWPQCQPLQ